MAPSDAVESSQPIPNSHSHRPLQREGACYFLSAAEQAMEDAMLRSSPPPEPVLGKRTRQEDDDGNIDTEPDEDLPSTSQQSLPPSVSNVADASRRYALKKKLRPEQRDEVDVFLLVSALSIHLRCLRLNFTQDTALGRQTKLFVCLLSLENKVDAFRSAAPPYQLSDELKVSIRSSMSSPLNFVIQTNINNYGIAVMLSVNISAYNGM